MKIKFVSWAILPLLWMAVPAFGQSLSQFGKKEVKVDEWVDKQFRKGTIPPFSFQYNGIHSSTFIKDWQFSAKKGKADAAGVANNSYSWKDKKTGLIVTCGLTYYPAYEAVEWVLRFTNSSEVNSPSVTNVSVIDVDWRYGGDNELLLHYANGSSASRSDFNPQQKVLKVGEPFEIYPQNGRSSDHAFPYFNIESKTDQGVMVAVGWTGTWYARFEKNAQQGLSLRAGMKELDTYLLAQETIRTPSICLLFWKSGDRMSGHNAFRRFMIEEQTP